MNCGNNHSCCDRMNRCGEMPRREMSRREMPTCEPVRPSCEMVRPTCEPVRPSCEMVRPEREMVRPSREMVRPSCEMKKPSCEMVRPAREMARPSREMVRPSCEMKKPSCEMVRPSCEMEKPSCEMMRPSCEPVRPAREMVRPSREHTRPSCSCEMPQNECVRPSRGCTAEKEVVENIIMQNDCSCQEFMRLNDWFNCTFDKSRREFMGAEKGLMDAKDCIKMGLCYNEKVKEISICMDEFLESMNEADSCETHHACHNRRNTSNCGCNTCGCNTNCNNSCMQRCEPMKCDPCMKMRRELNEMLCNLNKVEEESLECTQKAIDKLMEAGQLSKCICELKNKLAKNCYPKC